MTSTSTRRGAVDAAAKPGSGLQAEADASGPGLRDWFRGLGNVTDKQGVAFDTRFDAVAVLTGRASHGIARRLRGHGFTVAAEPESFLVDKHNELVPGETDQACAWGRRLVDVRSA
jgi:hypothetical protein